MIKIKKILIPIDFSDYSLKAVDYGMFLAKQFEAKILLLNVIPQEWLSETQIIETFGAVDSASELLNKRRQREQDKIEEIINKKEEEKALFDGGIVKEGIPAEEIVKTAKEKEIDLIIIATHGISGLSHILIGSVAEKVVRRAQCSVLTVRK